MRMIYMWLTELTSIPAIIMSKRLCIDELQASAMSNILWPMFLLLVLVFASSLTDAQNRKEITWVFFNTFLHTRAHMFYSENVTRSPWKKCELISMCFKLLIRAKLLHSTLNDILRNHVCPFGTWFRAKEIDFGCSDWRAGSIMWPRACWRSTEISGKTTLASSGTNCARGNWANTWKRRSPDWRSTSNTSRPTLRVSRTRPTGY